MNISSDYNITGVTGVSINSQMSKLVDALNNILHLVDIPESFMTEFYGGDSAGLESLEKINNDVHVMQVEERLGINMLTLINTVASILSSDSLIFFTDKGMIKGVTWKSALNL